MLRIREAFAATAFSLVLVAAPGHAQTIDSDLWVTNGDVYAVASHGGTIYIGGSFSEVGRATGTAVPIDAASGALPANFPKVNGQVHAVISDGAGGWYLGGEFTSIGGQNRNYIAQVASDLSVSSWNPNSNSYVRALALRGSTVYAGGYFTNIGGQPRNYLAALDAATGAASSWNPNANNYVFALAVNTHSFSCPEGTCFVTNVYVGGDFGTIGGQSRAYLAAIDATTGAASSWNPNANGRVIAVQAVGNSSASLRVYAGGFFGVIGGQARNYIAALNAAGNATTWNPNANNLVQTLAVSGGTVYAGGSFTSIGGQARNFIAALSNTGAATTWNPNANLSIQSLAVSGSTVYAGGDFTSIGGQPRNRIAALDAATGAATAWDPNANDVVRSVAVSGSTVYAGGNFTSFGVRQARNNVAALDVETGTVTAWNPDANAAVYALALAVSGEWVYTVYAGGDFNSIDGQYRDHLAALDAVTGVPTSWSAGVGTAIRCLTLSGPTIYAGGNLAGVQGFDTTTGARTLFTSSNGYVRSIAVSGNFLYAGGEFTEFDLQPRNHIARIHLGGGFSSWNPNANGTVRCLAVSGSTLYTGGDFTNIGGQSRNRVAAIDATTGGATLWHPNANDAVHSLVLSGSTAYAGGLFTNIGGLVRNRIAALDVTTGLGTNWDPNADGLVRALAVNGTTVYAGGSFYTIGGQRQRSIAAIESPTSVTCMGSGPSSPAGDSPRAIVGADLDNDGIRDLVVCSALPAATVLRGGGTGGVGDGTFSIAQTLSLGSKPMHVVTADFDSDGFQDLAISQATQAVSTGSVEVFLNNGGTLQPSSTIPLVGRPDGLASADMDLDGILDLVVCLNDSASNPNRGGVQVLRGGGQGGVWDGTFVVGPKFSSSTTASGRVLVQDFNQDGVPDISFTTSTGNLRTLRFGSPLIPVCIESTSSRHGGNLTTGDFNEDGRQDIAWANSETIGIALKTAATIPQCSGAWFSYPDPDSLTYLPSPSRDIAALDFDQDGILDLAVTLEGSVQLLPGRGAGGVGDGTFDPPITLASIDAWGIAVGDFMTNGSPDLAVSQRMCGSVSIIPQTSAPTLPINLTLQSPNGGEVWPQGIVAPTTWSAGDVMACGVAVTSDGRTTLQPVLATSGSDVRRSGSLQQIASPQQITWTKGAGVQGVDVEVSRDDGISWQPIATNAPGTSMTWIVTSPGTPRARVRLSDAAVAQRSDASDGAFLIPGGPTGVSPDEPAPLVAAFSLHDRNPVRGVVHFRMSVPAATEVEVEVFDVSGRLVRSLADGRVAAGSHDVVWDTRDARGSVASRGVYFVRARFDSFTAQRKVVVLR